jgi:catechol 2,3-dioxygenase-like lactoylglutathione lyase family enzyme
MDIQGFHHVAYRCDNAKQTVEFYQQVLGMDFQLAIAEDKVPSTGEPDPYMHIFMDAGNGNVLAFFELPQSKKMGSDPNTPKWVQHIALKIPDMERLLASKAHIERCGIEVLGPIDHTLFQSIYFFDPSGHRLELATDTAQPGMLEELHRVAPAMLAEWDNTKCAPNHAAWLHDQTKSFTKGKPV